MERFPRTQGGANGSRESERSVCLALTRTLGPQSEKRWPGPSGALGLLGERQVRREASHRGLALCREK